jgi:hypothetical protein
VYYDTVVSHSNRLPDVFNTIRYGVAHATLPNNSKYSTRSQHNTVLYWFSSSTLLEALRTAQHKVGIVALKVVVRGARYSMKDACPHRN